MAFIPAVDKEKCNGCEECLEVCTAQVFEMNSGKACPVNADECQGCESCIDVCREKAITVTDSRVQLSDTCRSLLSDIL